MRTFGPDAAKVNTICTAFHHDGRSARSLARV